MIPGNSPITIASTHSEFKRGIFEGGHWQWRPDNVELHTIHHLGGGLFVRGGEAIRARPL